MEVDDRDVCALTQGMQNGCETTKMSKKRKNKSSHDSKETAVDGSCTKAKKRPKLIIDKPSADINDTETRIDESAVLERIERTVLKPLPLHHPDKPQQQPSTSSISRESALDYLHLWSAERERWAFKKKTQYWLLQNMYDKRQVPKRDFKTLLLYLEGLQGRQKELAVERAQKFLEMYQTETGECDVSKREYKRAVAVLRAIA